MSNFPDKLNKLYIDTHQLLEKYTARVTEETPLLVEELKSVIYALDGSYENLTESSSDRDIDYCLGKYETYYSKLLEFDSLLIPEVIEQDLLKKREEHEKREKEYRENRKKQAILEAQMDCSSWVNDMRKTYHYQ